MSDALRRAAAHATRYLDELPVRPVCASADADEIARRLRVPLQDESLPAARVIDDLVRDVERGLVGSAGGRFFGWVIGGGLPSALAADWLTSAWDQNAVLHACGPAVAVVEDVAGEWLKQLLGLPTHASFGFVTGCQMAHVTALATGRLALLERLGWNVVTRGLAGSPRVRVLTSAMRHDSLVRAARLVGIGTDAVEPIEVRDDGALDVTALESRLAGDAAPTVVCLQAGDINTGRFDPFEPACAVSHRHRAWVHVDGAFGLWAAVSERHAHLVRGVGDADSWATDAHKWLNVPFDCGLVFVATPEAHRRLLGTSAAYLTPAGPDHRDQLDWTPEWSRRARGVPVYAALRSLGRSGLRDLVNRCCEHATSLVESLGALPGVEVLARPCLNQGLVRFLSATGDHDTATDRVVERIQRGGEAWFTGTTWHGLRAMRISVCNWRTTAGDVERAVEAVRRALVD